METWGTGKDARLKSWAVFMAGASGCLSYQRGEWKYPISHVRDMNRLGEFAERVRELNYLLPNDSLRYGGTEYVLFNKVRGSYVLYSSTKKQYLGVKGLSKGTYQLNWFSCTTGRKIRKKVVLAGGSVGFKKPVPAWTEMALYLKKTA
jgi:hypothetical protein